MKKIRKGLLIASLLGVAVCSAGLLSACKKEATVKLVFDEKGGASVADKELKVGTTYTLPTPTYEGYSFEGWYTNADYTGEPVTEVKATKGQTYYAKWVKLYTLTLDLNGGTMDKSSTVSIKQGANVYNALAEYIPTKTGLTFGAWFNGNNELSKDTTMTADLSLKAKYKVAYTVEIYKERLDGSGFEKADDIVGYEYPGVEYSSEQKLEGFKEFKHDNTVTDKVLSETATQNVFKHYYHRETYTVSFVPTYPDGTAGETKKLQGKYGAEVEIPSDYEYAGYCLIGWSDVPQGEATLPANYISNVLYNKDESVKAEKMVIESDGTYYGVWQKGYKDMFGGTDTVFIIGEEEEEKVAYLARGGFLFKGTYTLKKNEFRFTELTNPIIGRLYDDDKFILCDDARAGAIHKLYVAGAETPLVETTTVMFDQYNGITYREKGKENSVGTYVVENGYYVVTYSQGAYKGKKMYLSVTTTELNGVSTPIFQVRNEKEYGLGEIKMATVDGGLLVLDDAYTIKLNGFGSATYTAPDGSSVFSYTYDEANNLLTLVSSMGDKIQCRLQTVNNKKSFVVYSEEMDKTYDIVKDTETLKLDGACVAVYTNGTTEIEGYYTTKESVFGGTIVEMQTKAGAKYAFVITANDSQGSVSYETEKKAGGYAEYYYVQYDEDKNQVALYYAPLLVLNDDAEGEATLYGYTQSQTFEKVSEGTYTFDDETGLYTYDADEHFTPAQAVVALFDVLEVQSCEFALNTDTYTVGVSYWYSWTSKDDVVTPIAKTYTSDKEGTLTLVGGFAFYEEMGVELSGTYVFDDGYVKLTTKDGDSFYYELTGRKFITMQSMPYDLFFMRPNGTTIQGTYISLNGKGGAEYVIKTFDEKGEVADVQTTVGTVETLNESTNSGAPVYRFTSSTITFKYIVLGNGVNWFYAPFNDDYNGTYNSTKSGRLELDGYGYMAYYTDENGNRTSGRYLINEEGTVCVTLNGTERYFDVEGRTFTLRGIEYGTYAVLKNQIFNGVYIELNGYDKAVAFKYVDEERVDIDINGSYEKTANGYKITYQDDTNKIVLDGALDGETFNIRNSSAVQTYINKNDWSILTLDDVGNAIRYTADGKTEKGKYTLVTDTLLYFVNNAGTNACIYVYDKAKGEATPCALTATSYYTQELESLYFSQYGFAIFNGGTRYYYNKVGNSVVMYRQAEEDELNQANEYGFIEDTSFGTLDATKEYGGKTYYRYYGTAIRFVREEATKTHYPIVLGTDKWNLEALSFMPTGEMEFEVVGTVVFNGKTYSCQVIRKMVDDKMEMYFTIGLNIGYYRFDIEATYNGTGADDDTPNTYEITAYTWVISSYSYKYLDTYYRHFLSDYQYGTSLLEGYTNDIGYVEIHRAYDKDGNVLEDGHFLTAEFLEGSKMYDTTGAIVSFEKAELISTDDLMKHEAIFEAEDGYTYHVHFQLVYHGAFGLYGYYVDAFTREETFDANDGYKVVIERKLASDGNAFTIGVNSKVLLIKDGVTTDLNSFNAWALIGGNYYYIDSIYADDDVNQERDPIKETYYSVHCKTASDGTLDQDAKVPAPYESVTVIVEESKTYHSEDGKSWATIIPSWGVTLFSYGSTDNEKEEVPFAVAESCTYDEATQTYTVKLFKKNYKITIVGEYITVEVVDAEE